MNKENKEKVKPDVCLIKGCNRLIHKKSIYCIFHARAEEKIEKEFKEAMEKYIEKIKEDNLDYNFTKFIFIGDIDFERDFKVNTFKNANFWEAILEGNAIFKGATFKGNAIFGKAIFKGVAAFGWTTFEREVNFQMAIFEGNAFFRKANFKSNADFSKSTFKSIANFLGPTFKGLANFYGSTFKGSTNFILTNFEGNADFSKATFKGVAAFNQVNFKDANFALKHFVEHLSFSRIKVFPGKKLSIKLNNVRGKISFKRAYLENVYLNIELNEGILIDFYDALVRNTMIERDQIENHILQEKEKEFSRAKKVYLLLKNNFHSIGQYEDESWAFKKEKDMERLSYSFNSFAKNKESKEKKGKGKALKEKKSKFTLFFNWLRTKYFRKWISLSFSNIIYGYGERPQNVIFSALFIIILFSIFFSILGITSPEIIEMEGPTVQEIFNSDSEILFKGNLLNKTTNYFLDCLYFSVITFTTLGFGDFRPLEGWSRIFAGTEAFIGAFMMALFVYTFARRTGGR